MQGGWEFLKEIAPTLQNVLKYHEKVRTSKQKLEVALEETENWLQQSKDRQQVINEKLSKLAYSLKDNAKAVIEQAERLLTQQTGAMMVVRAVLSPIFEDILCQLEKKRQELEEVNEKLRQQIEIRVSVGEISPVNIVYQSQSTPVQQNFLFVSIPEWVTEEQFKRRSVVTFKIKLLGQTEVLESLANARAETSSTRVIDIYENGIEYNVFTFGREPFMHEAFNEYKFEIGKIHRQHAALYLKRVFACEGANFATRAHEATANARQPNASDRRPLTQQQSRLPANIQEAGANHDDDNNHKYFKSNQFNQTQSASEQPQAYRYEVYLKLLGVNSVHILREDDKQRFILITRLKNLLTSKDASVSTHEPTTRSSNAHALNKREDDRVSIVPGKQCQIMGKGKEIELKSGDLVTLVMKSQGGQLVPFIQYKISWTVA